MVTIRQHLVPAAVAAKVTSSGTSRRTGITIHETANRARGANAAAHARLQARGNSRSASWHWTVDDTEAVQSFPHTARCWHAGDGTRGGYDTIGIEICVNEGGDYAQALRNAAELVRHIRATDPAVGGALVQHHHWTRKNCPTRLRAGEQGGWSAFLDLVAGAAPVAKPVTPAKPTPTTRDEVTMQVTIGRLRRGNRGPDVRLLQGVLNVHRAGVAAGVGVLVEDGIFGPRTDRALRAHQAAHRIAVDGVAGVNSWRTLLEDVPA